MLRQPLKRLCQMVLVERRNQKFRHLESQGKPENGWVLRFA